MLADEKSGFADGLGPSGCRLGEDSLLFILSFNKLMSMLLFVDLGRIKRFFLFSFCWLPRIKTALIPVDHHIGCRVWSFKVIWLWGGARSLKRSPIVFVVPEVVSSHHYNGYIIKKSCSVCDTVLVECQRSAFNMANCELCSSE